MSRQASARIYALRRGSLEKVSNTQNEWPRPDHLVPPAGIEPTLAV